MSESTALDAPRRPWREFIKRRIVCSFNAALVGGRPQAAYLRDLGMPEDRIFIGYDVVDNEYFAKGAGHARSLRSATAAQYKLPQHYFLASARFVPKKNLRRLIAAYAEYRRNAQTGNQRAQIWDLVLLGDGELRSTLLALRSSLGLEGCFHMPGFKQYPDLPAYYGLASAFVHASTTEQWGLVINEAMASGLPVLVSNRCGCAPDLVQEGINGFTFDPFDTKQLAAAMLKLSTPDFQLSTMAEASRRIIAEWTLARFAAGLTAAAQKAIEVGPRKHAVLNGLLLRALPFR